MFFQPECFPATTNLLSIHGSSRVISREDNLSDLDCMQRLQMYVYVKNHEAVVTKLLCYNLN